MKKILFFSILLTVFSIGAFAQTQPTPAPQQSAQPAPKSKKGDKTNNGNRLNMTSDQRKQMHQIKEAQNEKKASIMHNNSLSQDQKKQQMKDLGTQSKAQKSKVLTSSQRQQQAQMKSSKKANMDHSKYSKKGQGKRAGSLTPSLQ